MKSIAVTSTRYTTTGKMRWEAVYTKEEIPVPIGNNPYAKLVHKGSKEVATIANEEYTPSYTLLAHLECVEDMKEQYPGIEQERAETFCIACVQAAEQASMKREQKLLQWWANKYNVPVETINIEAVKHLKGIITIKMDNI